MGVRKKRKKLRGRMREKVQWVDQPFVNPSLLSFHEFIGSLSLCGGVGMG